MHLKTLGTKILLSKETGLRPIKVQTLKVNDVNLETKLIYPTTAKHGSARVLKISTTLATKYRDT